MAHCYELLPVAFIGLLLLSVDAEMWLLAYPGLVNCFYYSLTSSIQFTHSEKIVNFTSGRQIRRYTNFGRLANESRAEFAGY